MESAPEVNEYDALYDVPKAEISLEKAGEIERESWSTTKILTEAFGGDAEESFPDSVTPPPVEKSAPMLPFKAVKAEEAPAPIAESPIAEIPIAENPISAPGSPLQSESLTDKLHAVLGELADFISLCESASPMEQRKFATSHTLSLDELADRINECAVDVFGDILLEEDCGAYRIIEDYKDQF